MSGAGTAEGAGGASPETGGPVSPFVGDSEMAVRMRAFDWSSTPIGPVDEWPASLRTAVGICLASRHPMVIWWGPELVLLYNDAWVPILGPSKHPALGRPGASVWPEMWHIIGAQMRSVLASGQATWSDDELLPAHRFGYLEEAYFTYSYSAVHDETGRVGGVFTAVTETTGRVLSERRLRTLRALGEVSTVVAESVEEACAAALDVLSRNRADLPFALLYLLSDDGRSARLSSAYGVVDATIPRALPHPTFGRSIWEAATTGEATVSPGLATRHPDAFLPAVIAIGDARPDTAVAYPFGAGSTGRPVGVLVTGISPFRALDADYRGFCDLIAGQVDAAVDAARAYESERRRAEGLAELDRAKTEFFFNVSHEFRTPLTLIMGPAATLRAAPEIRADLGLREEVEVIHRNGLRLGKLINTLLDFSRLQAGRIRAQFEPVDLAAVTVDLASVFRSAVERAGLRYEVDCPPLPEPVHVDREMWEKVVLNLLSNALKFTFDGVISLSLRHDGDAAVLAVADSGIGVAAHELPRLFDRFHRVGRARGRSSEGSGIGLALVQELVALHGGSIAVTSTPQVGTTFTVSVPLGRDHLPADQIVAASPVTVASETAQPFVEEALRWLPGDDAPLGETRLDPPGVERTDVDPPTRTAGRVLVADDNADMREYLQRLLGTRYAVQVVTDGISAVQAARERPPDLIVSDVMMPGMDGLELVATLRNDARTSRIPVLLLSARAGQEAAVEGLAAGADDYLVKPFSARELIARVAAHLELGRVRREAEQRFAAMADLVPALIWVCDTEGRRLFTNSGWPSFTGTAAPAARWQADVHPDDLDGYVAGFAAALERREPWQTEFRLRRPDGTYHWMLEHAVPVGNGDGFAGYVGSAVDINARYRETERQRLLADVSAALDADSGTAGRLDAAVRFLVDSRLADQCLALRVGADGALTAMAAAASDGDAETMLKLAGELASARQVLRTGRALLLTDIDRNAAGVTDTGRLALRRAIAPTRSAIVVPLNARGRTLGILALGRHEESPRYDTDDLTLVEEIAGRTGVALDNALLLAEERATARRLELLQQATAALSAAATPAEVAQVAITHFEALLDAPAVAVHELRDEHTLEMLAMRGWGVDRDWQTLPTDAETPAADVVRHRRALWIESMTDWERLFPDHVTGVRGLGFPAAVHIPLLVGDRCLGAIAIGFRQDRGLDPAERAATLTLAEQCSQALQRAQLLQAESAARRAAEQFGEMVGSLSTARGPVDVAQVILACASTLGSTAAVIVLRTGDDQLRLLAADGYPASASARLSTGAAHPLARAVRTGEPVWRESRSPTDWSGRSFDPGGPFPVQTAVPLIVDDVAIGAIGMRFPDQLRTFSLDERAMILTLAGQCAQALDRARLYQVEHEVAQTLQRSLLPARLPALDRLALARRYLPATENTQAGGDWYDVLTLDGTTIAIVVGDVVGHGPAAAAVMGQLRSALSTALLHGQGPAAALELLDRFAARIPGTTGSTSACVLLDWETGWLTWARAGHPPPLLLDGSGSRYLEAAGGTVLGVAGRAPFTEQHARIEPGGSILLYTDGLVERRAEVIDDGLDRLAATAADLRHLPPDALATELLDRTLDPTGPADDIALIVARLMPAPLHQRLSARPTGLSALRRTVQGWADAAALAEEATEDLQLAFGEAVANSIEHAYHGRDAGEFDYTLTRGADGSVTVHVRDYGTWRPVPADSGYRGRGVALIRRLADDVVLEPGPEGTRISFRLPPVTRCGDVTSGSDT